VVKAPIAAFGVCVVALAGRGPAAVNISGHSQLFLDDYLVSSMSNLRREIQPPTRMADPVLSREFPWEQRAFQVYGTMLYDEDYGKFRAWYLGSESPDAIPEYYVCYAESDDGVHWTKPMIGLEDFNGHAQTNVVIPGGHGISIMRTPWDPDPNRRYKAAGGGTLAYSPDGIHWTMQPWEEVDKNDTGTSVVWWQGEYLAFVRNQERDSRPSLQRAVGLSRSSNFDDWTTKETVFMTDAEDGHPWTQPYGLSVTAYGDQLIGLLWMLHLDEETGNNSRGDMDVQLMTSRDGENWNRVADRAVVMSQGLLEPFDQRSWDMRVFPGTTMLLRDDQIRIYYTGVNRRHGEGIPGRTSAIGLATLPADRFVALKAGAGIEIGDANRDGVVADGDLSILLAHWTGPGGAGATWKTGDFDGNGAISSVDLSLLLAHWTSGAGPEGAVETVPLAASQEHLVINAELGIGSVAVEVLDETGQIIPGFDRRASRLRIRDPLRYAVSWEHEGEFLSLGDAAGGRPFALRFILTGDAELYSFATAPTQVGDANSDRWVDDADLSLLLAHWTGAGATGGTWETGDFDGDGAVSDADLSFLLANWTGPLRPGSIGMPEPATAGMLLTAGVFLLRPRQHRARRASDSSRQGRTPGFWISDSRIRR